MNLELKQMTTELLYYIGEGNTKQPLTLIVVYPNTPTIATCLRKFYSLPPLPYLLAWQSFVVSMFPDISWSAKVKVEMKELGTVDRPSRIEREFTMTLKEVR